MRSIGIYIHIPFCADHCPFCAFSTVRYERDLISSYLKALEEELKHHRREHALGDRTLESIYLGGGTPSLIPPDRLRGLLQFICGQFRVPRVPEITLEATPESIQAAKARDWVRAGINRLSIGVQSFDSDELKHMGRNHTPDQARRAIRAARQAGCRNISLDLIYAIPNQSLDDWTRTVAQAVSCLPEHISVYGLTLEEGTSFFESAESGRWSPPGEEAQAAMYTAGRRMLIRSGYSQYEISNFARPGFQSRHNLLYWSDGEYLGLGASAHSHLHQTRFSNCFDPAEYVRCVGTSHTAVDRIEHLGPQEKAREAIAFGLRKAKGISLREVTGRYKIRLPKDFYRLLRDLQTQGYLIRAQGGMRLTPRGLLLADEVGQAIIAS